MWQIEETEDELTIKAIPVVVWLIVLGSFIWGIYFAHMYLEQIGGISNISKLFKGDGVGIVFVFIVLALFIGGLCFFHFLPYTITKFNRQKRIVSQSTYSLFGKRTREFGYDYLQSKVQGLSETMESTSYHWLFFYVQGGEKIKLSKASSGSVARNAEVAAKANEYLQPKTEEKK
ncbi:MAG TPA: hypothetical protein PKE69_02920 [Pyrinomonadaceae bacterium]|nr:hypothetical protein [Pyrinomonadaceae bacterium]